MSDDETSRGPGRWIMPLAFSFLTVPLLWGLTEKRQDCYRSKEDCERDWGTNCETNTTAATCPHIGRTYRSWFGSGSSGNHAVGHISRGGFGSTGHGHSSGG